MLAARRPALSVGGVVGVGRPVASVALGVCRVVSRTATTSRVGSAAST